MDLMTISDAAVLSGKSIQTIRRMIKQKKLRIKKQKTPQGFNYLIVKESLLEFINLRNQAATQNNSPSQPDTREHRPVRKESSDGFKEEIDRFNLTIQKLIEQNQKDKENFFQLIKTFQDRVFVLENQIKMLQGPARSWWKFWK